MSERLKSSLTITGPLLVLLTTLLDPRVSATLALTALMVFGIWMLLDARDCNKIPSTGHKVD